MERRKGISVELTVDDAGNVRGKGNTDLEAIDGLVVTLTNLDLLDIGPDMNTISIMEALVRIESAMVRNGK